MSGFFLLFLWTFRHISYFDIFMLFLWEKLCKTIPAPIIDTMQELFSNTIYLIVENIVEAPGKNVRWFKTIMICRFQKALILSFSK